MSISIPAARADFPILSTRINDHPLVYLDNAATTQKPQAVIDSLRDYYTFVNSNVHRGGHTLAVRATDMYEAAREKVARFINAAHAHEVIFTRGTTESINLVANSFGEAFIQPGDEIIVSELEHHSNYVPWFELCQRKGARFRVLPFTPLASWTRKFCKACSRKKPAAGAQPGFQIVGTVNPLEYLIPLAQRCRRSCVGGRRQSVQHMPRATSSPGRGLLRLLRAQDVRAMGIGVLYAKESWLEKLPPFLYGGEMIDQVSSTRVTFAQLPYKFEAGTPNVEGAVGLGAAVDYLNRFDQLELQAYEEDLLAYGIEQLRAIPGLTLYGNPRHRSSILPFNVEGIQHYDMGILLDTSGVAVRTGQHCTQPIMDALSISGTVRASLALYNNREDIDALTRGIRRVMKMLRR